MLPKYLYFILLDRIDGKVWQVQWSFDEENRTVVPVSRIVSAID